MTKMYRSDSPPTVLLSDKPSTEGRHFDSVTQVKEKYIWRGERLRKKDNLLSNSLQICRS